MQKVNWLTMYKHGHGVELGTTENNTKLGTDQDLNLQPPQLKSDSPTIWPCCFKQLGRL